LATLSFKVRGQKPKAYSTYETQWKEHLRDAALRAARDARLSIPEESCPIRVHATFYLVEHLLMRTDLDNLAKPLLDVLFRPRSNVNGLFPFADSCVLQLPLEKRPAVDASMQGCDVQLEW
jgi:hypothetical protein